MGELMKNRLILLNKKLYEIELEIAFVEDKIQDASMKGCRNYMKDLSNSTYSLEYLLDKKIKLQQQRNDTLFKIKIFKEH
jgi:hypothetical protein